MLPILKKQVGPKAIIGNNLSSHINMEVIKQWEMNNIKSIALPPNATHLLQPLDVAYFRPLKVSWRKILKDWKETAAGRRCMSVPKYQFPTLLKTLWDTDNGPDNLIGGFRKSGIHPRQAASSEEVTIGKFLLQLVKVLQNKFRIRVRRLPDVERCNGRKN